MLFIYLLVFLVLVFEFRASRLLSSLSYHLSYSTSPIYLKAEHNCDRNAMAYTRFYSQQLAPCMKQSWYSVHIYLKKGSGEKYEFE
jgi:hypothetical protein